MKILSNILLIFNAFSGFFIIALLFSGYWYLVPLIILVVIYNLKFYFYVNKEEHKKYEIWYKNFSEKHTYLGQDYYSEFWKNNKTGEIIEL